MTKPFSLPGLALGMLTAVAIEKWGRPVLVGSLRLGFEAADGVKRVFHEAREGASKVVADAKTETAVKKAG